MRFRKNHCCPGRAISSIFWVCVDSLSYPACKAHAPLCVVTCGLSRFTLLFPHIISQKARFSGGGLTEPKICFDFLYIFWLKYHSKKIWARYDRSLYLSSCRVPAIFVRFDENRIFSKYFGTTLNNKFHANPSSGVRVVPDLQNRLITEVKVKVALRNFWELF